MGVFEGSELSGSELSGSEFGDCIAGNLATGWFPWPDRPIHREDRSRLTVGEVVLRPAEISEIKRILEESQVLVRFKCSVTILLG